MTVNYIEKITEEIPLLQQEGESLSQAIHKIVLNGGDSTRNLADILHGTWLGHPLHPLLTDIVVGAWTLGALFDVISVGDNASQWEQIADKLTAIGTAAAIPTVISGATDFSTIPKSSAGIGLAHALATNASLVMYLLSLRARKNRQRSQGLLWSALGFGLVTAGAYLGGHLVFNKRVGVNRNGPVSGPQEWTPVLAEAELPEYEPHRIEVEEKPVLLYRRGNRIYAVGAVCPHAGGPLEEGYFTGNHVQCPWHDSVFCLEDGHVVHGPSTYAVPNYEARIQNGQIEVRLLEG
jgi:nitrite reductase/ring-hydroxylating ferredoxin subunit/uncharacterized membrane protein